MHAYIIGTRRIIIICHTYFIHYDTHRPVSPLMLPRLAGRVPERELPFRFLLRLGFGLALGFTTQYTVVYI